MFEAPDVGSPKSQLHPVGVPVEVSVNATFSAGPPVSGVPVKFATGGDTLPRDSTACQ